VALDTGARKGELCGLRWADMDLEQGKARIVQQSLVPGPDPVFGLTTSGRPRTVSLASESVELLRAHKSQQAAVKMVNSTTTATKGWCLRRNGRT